MAVRVIRARTPMAARAQEARKVRVAAYCRVSTDSEEQEGSYEAQKRHYEEYIEENPRWECAGIFADEGITGTQAKKRPEFLRMIEACESGEVDMVVTKSISRFARNTLDCLKYIRLLKEKGIPILFEKENINTMDAKGEVLITIMASIAQQESQSISQNVRIGIQYRMQQGHGRLNTSVFLGLTRGAEPGDLVIVPEEAKVVRRIFREFLEGYTPAMVCRRLEADGVLTGAGGTTWHPSTVCRMLENEKYCGDVLLQKYYTTDFLTHKVTKNTGQFPQYFVEGHHEPIVPKEVFRQVQGELMRRSAMKSDPSKLRYGAAIPFTGRLICGKCGRTLKRCVSAKGTPDWRCRNRGSKKKDRYKAQHSACGCRFVTEERMKVVIVEALNRLLGYRDELIRTQAGIREGELRRIDALAAQSRDTEIQLEERRARVLAEAEGERTEETDFLDGQSAALQEKRNALILERARHANREVHVRLLLELADIMMERRERLIVGLGISSGEDGVEEFPPYCSDYDEFFRRTRYVPPEGVIDEAGRVTRFEESLVIRYLDTVVVHDDCYEVKFKAGISIKV